MDELQCSIAPGLPEHLRTAMLAEIAEEAHANGWRYLDSYEDELGAWVIRFERARAN